MSITIGDDHKVWYKLPFDRFYMEESKAPQAEQLYWKAQRDSAQVVYALVSIGQGQAVLQDVIINDRPIIDIINELNEIDGIISFFTSNSNIYFRAIQYTL